MINLFFVILVFFPIFSWSNTTTERVSYICSGVNGSEYLFKKGGVASNNEVSLKELEYVFTYSNLNESLLLSINKAGVVKPENRIHSLKLVEYSNNVIIAIDTDSSMKWVYYIYPLQNTALFTYSQSSLRFSEIRTGRFFASCKISLSVN